MNIATLWLYGSSEGSNGWVSYKQAQALGGNVKKGETGSPIVYFSVIEKKPDQWKDPSKPEAYALLKYSTVFNLSQCENIDPAKIKKPKEWNGVPEGLQVPAIAEAHKVDLRHGGDRAYFAPGQDFVQMPYPEQFKLPEKYEAVLAHELTHWTGHKDRLNRDMSGMFGCEKYAKEELIAEMGSAFLAAQLGIQYHAADHGAYIQSWMKGLQDDPKLLLKAAAAAQKACNYLLDEVRTEPREEFTPDKPTEEAA
jgi:antirestriction protein ArdC